VLKVITNDSALLVASSSCCSASMCMKVVFIVLWLRDEHRDQGCQGLLIWQFQRFLLGLACLGRFALLV
jgi:hypothetical protein